MRRGMASLIAIVIFPTAIGWCQVEDRPQFLLLKNGQLLAGHVSLHGDRYLVAVPYGEIQVRRADVDQIVGSPQEAYLHRKNATRFGDADEHLRLAQWCLDRSLVAEAETQLEAAVGLQPHHPRVPLIERQLRLTTTPRSTAKSISATEQPARSADQLDGLVRGMPQGVVETFTKTIQPVLVNSCSARACHGSAAENGFRLWRYPRGQQVPQRVTLRNLDAVLRWVDQREPGSSRLLRAAAESHGSGRSSSALRGAPYQHLATWVEQIAGVSTDAPADTSAASSLTTELNVAPLTPPSSPHATRFARLSFGKTASHCTIQLNRG